MKIKTFKLKKKSLLRMTDVLKDPIIMVLLSAGLARLSFPKFDLFPLAWVAFIPLLFAIEQHKLVRVFFIAFFQGFIFFAMTIFWLNHVTLIGMVILSIYLALYTACVFAGYAFFKKSLTYGQRLVFLPCLWVVLEYIRSHVFTGFPWALLGYSQTYNLAAIQAADLFGVYGVSFIVIFSSGFLYEVIKDRMGQRHLTRLQMIVPAFVILAWFSYGVFRIHQDPHRQTPLKVSVVQGNISQDIKWVFSLKDSIFKRYQLLTDIVSLRDEPDLVVWPETAFPDALELGVDDGELKSFAARCNTSLLVGSIRLQGLRYFNSAILFSSRGDPVDFYDKIHLVPFGEYIPARRFLPFVTRVLPIEDFTRGEASKIFSIKAQDGQALKFGVLICFEDIFSGLATKLVTGGADFLVNMTNDAWFKDTSSPYQHMQASVFRAVENRVYCLRAANTGVSCFIDDVGRLVSVVTDSQGKATFVAACKTGFVYKTSRQALYTKIKDVFVGLCCLCVITLVVVVRRKP